MKQARRDGTTLDAFLGGRLVIAQPGRGYRAGADAVLLAAACPAAPGAEVLDLGCGAGTAALCLGARVGGLRLAGLEVQEEYAALARANAGRNALVFEVHEGDIVNMPAALRRPFDHVIVNPPWHSRLDTPSPLPSRALALQPAGPVAAWVRTAARRLRPGGTLTLITSAASLGEVLAALVPDLGAAVVLPLAARAGAPAGRVILRAIKGGRAPLALLAPMILHGVGGVSTAEARAILMDGAGLCQLFALSSRAREGESRAEESLSPGVAGPGAGLEAGRW